MRKMREIDGYMTLEASLIIPVLCFLLVLLFSFFFYIMDQGIVSGLVKEAGLHTEDKNQETDLRRDLERRIVLGKVSSVSVSETKEKRKIKVQAEIGVPAAGSVEIFGLRLFKITEQQEFMLPKETEKIRRWSLIE